MCLWSVAVAQLAGEAPPQLTWPAERTTLVRCPDPDERRPTPRPTKARAATDEVLRQVLKDGPLTVAQLLAATGWPRSNLLPRLVRAADRGVVRRVRHGVYAAAGG